MSANVSPLLGVRQATPPPASAAAPVDPGPSAAEVEAEATARARRAAIARRLQGRAGTIATSARGVLSPGQLAVQRRSLLGE